MPRASTVPATSASCGRSWCRCRWPPLLTLVVVNALYVWNDLLIAIIFLQDDAKRTLMAGISVFQGRYNDQIPLTMAGMAFASAPMIILYIAFQKHYIQGLMAGSVK